MLNPNPEKHIPRNRRDDFSLRIARNCRGENGVNNYMSYEKPPGLTFHYTGCFIRILIMVYHNPHIKGQSFIPNKSLKQQKRGPFFHCSTSWCGDSIACMCSCFFHKTLTEQELQAPWPEVCMLYFLQTFFRP